MFTTRFALSALFVSTSFLAATAGRADDFKCSGDLEPVATCQRVDGVQNFNHFVLCMKDWEDGSGASVEIQVGNVDAKGAITSQDQGDFDEVKDTTDANGKPVEEFLFNGQRTITSQSPTSIVSTYAQYKMVVNVGAPATDKSWTHKIYVYQHNVVKSRPNTETDTWKSTDVSVGVGIMLTPNKFNCYAPN